MATGIDVRAIVPRAIENGTYGFFETMLVCDWLRAFGREHGPVDGKCEVCHKEPKSGGFVLANHLDWHCADCNEDVYRAEHGLPPRVAA